MSTGGEQQPFSTSSSNNTQDQSVDAFFPNNNKSPAAVPISAHHSQQAYALNTSISKDFLVKRLQQGSPTNKQPLWVKGSLKINTDSPDSSFPPTPIGSPVDLEVF